VAKIRDVVLEAAVWVLRPLEIVFCGLGLYSYDLGLGLDGLVLNIFLYQIELTGQ